MAFYLLEWSMEREQKSEWSRMMHRVGRRARKAKKVQHSRIIQLDLAKRERQIKSLCENAIKKWMGKLMAFETKNYNVKILIQRLADGWKNLLAIKKYFTSACNVSLFIRKRWRDCVSFSFVVEWCLINCFCFDSIMRCRTWWHMISYRWTRICHTPLLGH